MTSARLMRSRCAGTLARVHVALLLALSADSIAAPALPTPEPSAPLFRERPFGPRPLPTQSAPAKPRSTEDEKPLPTSWIVAGVAIVVLATAGLLYAAARAWRSSNLFDREYRFPPRDSAALRLGGMKSGGHMASVEFGSPARREAQHAPASLASEAENA